jgi:mannose-1-phosphate guanylyltransferase
MKSKVRLGFADLFGESRWLGDLMSYPLSGLFSRTKPSARSHGRGVLLIPGFLSRDYSLSPLAARLEALGYRIFFSGIWYNVDCPVHILPRLEKVLRKANYKTHAKVVLIGHSLGGIYARELACRFPQLVERAILLGSPVKDPLESPNTFLRPVFQWWHRRCAEMVAGSASEAEVEESPNPPNVPETLIYSKTDGVVQWQNCIESGPEVETIEVPSSHCGLPYRPEVFEIIVDRLARCSEPSRSLTLIAAAPKYRPLKSASCLTRFGQALAASCLMPFLFARFREAPLNEVRVLKVRPHDKKRTNLGRLHLQISQSPNPESWSEPMKPDHEVPMEAGAIILAGGDGTRLVSLTRKIAGRDLPKQFCTILEEETLLEQTMRRVSLSISTERTVTVLTRAHEQFYSDLIADLPVRNLAIQPANRGTAVAILFGLIRLITLRRISTVVIFPSDHYVDDESIFMRHVDAAISGVSSPPSKIVLLRIPADRPESDYGWIEPAEQLTQSSSGVKPIFRIRRFWEKPPPQLAVDLWSRGLLWNSFVVVARVAALIDMFARMIPRLYLSFAKIRAVLNTSAETDAVDKLFADLPSLNFSEAILAGCPSELSVLPTTGVRWNDLGEPSRVMATLAKAGLRPGWLAANRSTD